MTALLHTILKTLKRESNSQLFLALKVIFTFLYVCHKLKKKKNCEP